MTGQDPYRADVLTDGQRIAEIAPDITTGDAKVIDCAGATITPGWIDAHVHFDGDTSGEEYRRYLSPDDRVRTINALLTARTTLEAGFTTVRDAGLTGAGYALRYTINSGWILGPRILTAGPSISATGGHGDVHALPPELVRERRPRSILADGVWEVRRAVRQLHREGADLVKIFVSSGSLGAPSDWPPLTWYTVDEISAITDEAHRLHMRVASHALGVEAMRAAILGGTDTIEHGSLLEGEDPDEVLDLMRKSGVYYVPTLSVYYQAIHHGADWGLFEGGVSRAEGALERSSRIISEARNRGVSIALGTDTCSRTGVGENAHEFVLLCEAGLSPMEALQAGTKVCAEALGIGSQVGTLEVGKLADLIVIDGNPLDDLSIVRDKRNIRHIAKAEEPISTRW